ncbi:PGF-pre-PGF domain-containing protein [Methanolobus sediminis]|uniref:PGF-pre-PGF domain-containing protein n=1 Tax=Methanolobus sediminis TaxID=3072978 RepID=A0AA51UM31_9EURY|nr:PGF-pre-PGF domain-containing protein [Methanolobus sediminis]WMW25860.1 PGF-pre-PGF domain-containing protein [Methanolobus sediminis]
MLLLVFLNGPPTYEQAGDYLVQFVVSDGSHLDSEYITITVKNTNRAPIFSAIADSSKNEGEEIQLTLAATDEDSDILAFSKDVSFGTLEGNIFTWTPDYDDQGEHDIIFSVTDGSSSVSQTALITVSNVNRDPILFSISDVSVNETTPVTIQLDAFDADGDELTYTMVSSLPTGASFDSEIGLFQWPNPTTSSRVLTFSVSDGFLSDTKYPQIVIGDSNSPPEFNMVDSQSIDENSELSFDITAYDNDNDKIDIVLSSSPSGSYLTGSVPPVTFTWLPNYDLSGIYKVEFKVSETNTKDRYATYQVVDIVVNDVNRAPVIDAVDDYTVSENGLLYVNLSATDPDGDTLTYSTDSSLGIVRGNTFICTPDYNDADVYDVQYTVSDGNLKNSTMATITVTDSNMPPKLNSISAQEVAVNNTLDFSLSVSDDDEGETFSYKALDLPSTASFDESTGVFEWTPSSEDIGDYSVSFYVSDSSQEDYETVSITVTETSSSSSSSSTTSSSSSGGGGSQNTGEPYENIELKDYVLRSVMRDTETVFSFNEDENSITSISFTSKLNAGQIKAMVEILKGTSTLVDSKAPGTVYKNLNIWVGDSKFSSDVISDVIIRFKVEKSWVYFNDVEQDSIVLSRYSGGEWTLLETTFESEDEDYLYYSAETPGFSPFAILVPGVTTLIESSSAENQSAMSIGDEIVPVGTEVPQDKKSNKGILLLLLVGMIGAIGFVGYKYRGHYEQLYLQISNPDGKRYRRLKK